MPSAGDVSAERDEAHAEYLTMMASISSTGRRSEEAWLRALFILLGSLTDKDRRGAGIFGGGLGAVWRGDSHSGADGWLGSGMGSCVGWGNCERGRAMGRPGGMKRAGAAARGVTL